ncbi:MAG: type II secretion system F family protein [Actinomycetota bacterium]|nr:type II secretion system F family protein [Actinomycetota bacterium]
MPKYTYSAIGADGVNVSGVEEALTLGGARRALVARDLAPVEVKEKRNVLQLEITKKRVKRRDLMHFSRQMAVFTRAGIPVLEALDVMTEELGNQRFAVVIAEMADALRGGSTFAGAASEHPDVFPAYYLGILRSAELTGNLDTALDQLGDYIERDLEARRKVISAVTYPAIVLCFAVLAIIVIVAIALPRFKTFFASLTAKLPLVTRMLMAVANFFSNDWLIVLAVVIVLAALAALGMVTAKGREIRDKLVLRLPVAGDLVLTALIERFCRILYSMVAAGVPLPDALLVTTQTTTNFVFRQGLTTARSAMMRGEGLAGPLNASGLFPPTARHMFLVGERTGTMDDQLETAATYYDQELDYKLKRFTALFEPAVIVFVGFVVGFVAIALISAMYGIYRQVHLP